MDKVRVQTEKAPAAIGPYSQGIIAGGFVYTSGQVPFDANGTFPEGIVAQTHQSLQNVQAILEEAGSSFDKAVKVTVYLKDMNDFAAMNEVYATYFKGEAPARVTVEVARLPKDALIEIDTIALV